MLYNSQKKGSIPTVTYKLDNTIRNNILNYKDVVNSIYVDEEVSICWNTDLRDCQKSNLSKQHNNIITGDLRIIENKKA